MKGILKTLMQRSATGLEKTSLDWNKKIDDPGGIASGKTRWNRTDGELRNYLMCTAKMETSHSSPSKSGAHNDRYL